MTKAQEQCLKFLKKFGVPSKMYGEGIVKALADSNIFIATAVAQKCLESGYGTSRLAKRNNNFGGIKGKPEYAIGRDENGWAKFATPYDSFRSYAYFVNNLEDGNRYAKALRAKTPEDQIYELVYAGYCTSPTRREFENGCWKMKNKQCVGKKYVFKNEAEYLDVRAKDYLSGCTGFISILNQYGIGGKIANKDVASVIKMINEIKI